MSDEDDLAFTGDEDDAEQGAETASGKKPAERKHRRIARERAESDKFWRDCLSTPVGRREIWGLLMSGGLLENAFACGPTGFPQPDATMFKAGAKDLAQRIYTMLQVRDYPGVHLMHIEHDPRFANVQRTAPKDKN